MVAPDSTEFLTLRLRGLPNEYLLCPKGFAASPPHDTAPVFSVSVAALGAAFEGVLSAEPRLDIIATDAQARRFEYLLRSRLFGFPDRVSVRLLALDPGRSTLAVYGRAVIGVWDFGVNRRRVGRWVRRLEAKLLVKRA
jgi:uncharacterized protein (DUF1499 family)